MLSNEVGFLMLERSRKVRLPIMTPGTLMYLLPEIGEVVMFVIETRFIIIRGVPAWLGF